MTLFLREIFGWLLVGIGLAVFFLCYQTLRAQRVIDCIPLTIIGFIIFRGGLHLIKVATAARVARAPDDARDVLQGPVARPPRTRNLA